MLFALLIIYQLKHFICDYLLQGKYMLGKFQKYPDFILPLLAHVGVHAVATFGIALAIKPNLALPLAIADAVIHFIVDRVKASPTMLGRYKALAAAEYPTVAAMAQGVMPIPLTKAETLEKQIWAINRLKSNVLFWWMLGLDQMAHHLTHYAIIWFLVK